MAVHTASTGTLLLAVWASLLVCCYSSALSASPSATAAAIRALDTDGSGKVERNEIEAFATRQGLSAEEVQAEFRDLDRNGDGELQADEIGRTLDEAVLAPAAVVAPAQPVAPLPAASSSNFLAPAPVAFTGASSIVNSGMQQQLRPAAYAGQGTLQQTAVTSLQADALVAQAEAQADRTIAGAFTQSAGTALQQREEHQRRAVELEERARQFREQASQITRTARAETQAAAKTAASSVLQQATTKVQELEQQASAMMAAAVEKRGSAREALMRVRSGQAAMSSSVKGFKL